MSQEEQDIILARAVREHASCQRERAALKLKLCEIDQLMAEAATELRVAMYTTSVEMAGNALRILERLENAGSARSLIGEWIALRERELELHASIEAMK